MKGNLVSELISLGNFSDEKANASWAPSTIVHPHLTKVNGKFAESDLKSLGDTIDIVLRSHGYPKVG
jgi:hypothetical protein